MKLVTVLALSLLVAAPALAQTPIPVPAARPGPMFDPFPPMATEGAVRVNIVEFATLPDSLKAPARAMNLVLEPGGRRLFVNDMNGPLLAVSADGRTVGKYLDLSEARWGLKPQVEGRERGFQNVAFHPQFNQRGARGYGKFYTYFDTADQAPAPDFVAGGTATTHDTVLLEWTARTPGASTYDGGPPRELMRFRQPFPNHNGGDLAFHPNQRPGSPEAGLLYIGVADGGSQGDPFKNAQKLTNGFGKIFRIDPLGSNSANGKYGYPAANPFAADNDPATLGEIYAYGLRNPQRFGWDPKTGAMLVADIGQNYVEKVSLVTRGANLGWSEWEGSYRFVNPTDLRLDQRRLDPKVTYPLVEFDHADPLLLPRSAVTGVIAYRASAIPQLKDKVLFGDITGGEMFWFDADARLSGGSGAIRRVVFGTTGEPRTFMQLVKEKAAAQGRDAPVRIDLRMAEGPSGEIYLLNRADGVIRVLRP